MILYLNACVRSDSRTKRIADALITGLAEPVTELSLEDISFPRVDEQFLSRRDELKSMGSFSDPVFDQARQFASADRIVIAAPYWDLSFPATLKQYLELINVCGVTFEYTDEGTVRGLCKASELYYVTTAGGDFCPDEYGYGYVKALAQNYYGISDVHLIKATGLDIAGADPEKIVSDAIERISVS